MDFQIFFQKSPFLRNNRGRLVHYNKQKADNAAAAVSLPRERRTDQEGRERDGLECEG